MLAQHVVTVAASGPFDGDELLREVRGTRAFRALEDQEWAWVLEFVQFGGEALSGYERYARLERGKDGRYRAGSRAVVRDHRVNIGTIAGYGNASRSRSAAASGWGPSRRCSSRG